MPTREIVTSVGPVTIQTFKVQMDPIETFDIGVEAGQYDDKNPKIWELQFPFERQFGEIDLALLFFKGRVYRSGAIRGMGEIGLHPSTTAEFLAFGAQHPEEQLQKYWITAVGAVRERANDGISYALNLVSSLDRNTSRKLRELSLSWTAYRGIEMEFEQRSRFLARFRDAAHVQEILKKYAA